MSESRRIEWGPTVGWGLVAGLTPIPVIVGATVLFDVLGGSGDAVRSFMVATGIIVGIGGGAALSFYFGRRVSRSAGHAELVYGLGVGIVAAVSDLVAVVLLGGAIPIPVAIALILRPPAGLVGGWTATRDEPARSAVEPAGPTS